MKHDVKISSHVATNIFISVDQDNGEFSQLRENLLMENAMEEWIDENKNDLNFDPIGSCYCC